VTDNKIGVNTKGIDKDIILGKEIGKGFGRGSESKQKAMDAAAANEGSELVYEKADGWHVSEVHEEGLTGSSTLSKKDSSDIKLYTENLNKLGIKASTISFVEDDFKKLAEDDDLEIRAKVAKNPATPVEIINELSQSKYYTIREAAGSNKSAPPEVLIALAGDVDYRVRIAVASNPSTPKDVLSDQAHDGLNENPPNPYLFKIQQAVAANPSIPVEVLRELFAKGTFNAQLSVNPSTPDDILKKIFDKK
jgi:hypothetical protein